jgi:restriction endonuclease S subunit
MTIRKFPLSIVPYSEQQAYAALAFAFAQLGNLSQTKQNVALYKEMKEMYEDEGLDGWNAEEIQTILAECESNIKIADDFILSRGRLQLDMGEGFGNDFANKFPFIDDERTI